MNPPDCSQPVPATSALRRPKARRALISLTPLIDVVFILLVFFMLASSFLDWRSIDLNTPAQAAAGSSMEGALLIDLRTDGLRLAGRRLSLDALDAQVRMRLAEKPGQRVLVRPQAGVTLQRAVRVLDRLSAAGVTDLSLVRDRQR